MDTPLLGSKRISHSWASVSYWKAASRDTEKNLITFLVASLGDRLESGQVDPGIPLFPSTLSGCEPR